MTTRVPTPPPLPPRSWAPATPPSGPHTSPAIADAPAARPLLPVTASAVTSSSTSSRTSTVSRSPTPRALKHPAPPRPTSPRHLGLPALLDITLSWKARRNMSFTVQLRYLLKVISAAAWVVILPVTYTYNLENPSRIARTIKSWFGNNQNQSSLYILDVVIYLSPNMLVTLLFLFPFLRLSLERSNYKIVRLMMWWSQPRLFVERGMHENAFSLFMYTMFWMVLISTKLTFSHYVEVT